MHTKITISGKRNIVTFTLLLFVLFISSRASAATVTVSVNSNFTTFQDATYSGPYVSGSSGPRYMGPAEDVIINSGRTLTINLSNQTVKSITMGNVTATSPVLAMGANTLTVTNGFSSNTTASKKITFSGAGLLICGGFTGTGYALTPSTGKIRMTGGNLPAGVLSFYNLSILAPSSTVTLSNSVNVTNVLELNNGILDAGTYNITVKYLAGSGGIAGTAPSSNSFVRTSNGGTVTRTAGNGVLYPVGATFYAPVTLGVTSTTKTFAVNVIDGIDNINGDPITSHVILNTWSISATASSVNPDVLVKLDWQNDSREGTGFDDTKNALFIFEPGATEWTLLNTFTNETSNSQQNLAVNKFQVNDVYKFAVGDVDGFNLLNNTVALPVELVSFTANKISEAQAKLDWSTAWEANNRGFEIERSTNGAYWANIGFVEGHGNSNQLLNYSFATPLAGINSSLVYYRLKQVDFNGSFQYSPVRTIRLNSAVSSVEEVYPNPVTNRVSINLGSIGIGETAKVTILDMTGKVVLSSEQLIIEENNFILNMNVENLKKGNYIVNISSVTTSRNVKLVKL